MEGESEISVLIACLYQPKSEAGDPMYTSNIEPQHLTKIDCDLIDMTEPSTPNRGSYKPKQRD